MTARVIQGFFVDGRPRMADVAAQPGAALGATPRPPGPPAPAFAGRPRPVQANAAGGSFPVDPARLGLASGAGRPLPDGVRGKMEAALGADFSGVRVHIGPQAERIGAIAFTTGTDIYFAPGRFQPDTTQGQQLLGHELAHVVQQRQGRVRGPAGAGMAVVQDRALEAEADRLGQRAAAHRPSVQPKLARGTTTPASPVRISSPMSTGSGSYRLVANTGGRQVGSVMVHARENGAVEVTDLGVEQTQRGRGIGQMLVASAAKSGLQFGKSKVTLAAQDRGSGRLRQWYKGMGFAQVGVNERGYPRLEAPIGRVICGAVQRRLATPGAAPVRPPSLPHGGPAIQRAQRSWADLAKQAPSQPPKQPPPSPKAQVAPQVTYRWSITKSARRHYSDGWGDKYGITTDEELKTYMLSPGNDLGEGDGASFKNPAEISLGTYKVKGVGQSCNILYYNEWDGNECTTVVFHCGPALTA